MAPRAAVAIKMNGDHLKRRIHVMHCRFTNQVERERTLEQLLISKSNVRNTWGEKGIGFLQSRRFLHPTQRTSFQMKQRRNIQRKRRGEGD
ncbi:hypothetical protein L1987_00749 [Smallanthus sonchifolius]|uniref:Uncharacterized protein n=1 Tax=Smallanthus sonchifolius TaxID=185202 RepID=A0ACB9K370_9ASTR|nr:hypothetical protein L1987_00749 [Smallanthus sonchifolius]